MKEVPETFKHHGFLYKLVKRTSAVALYSQELPEGIVGYEVHKIRKSKPGTTKYRNPDGTIRLVEREEREYLAGDEDFGYFGWSYQELKNAEKKYEELNQPLDCSPQSA